MDLRCLAVGAFQSVCRVIIKVLYFSYKVVQMGPVHSMTLRAEGALFAGGFNVLVLSGKISNLVA